jgi:cellulose synthase (UDP-forming)
MKVSAVPFVIWFFGLSAFIFLATLPTEREVQLITSGFLLLVLGGFYQYSLRRKSKADSELVRIVIIVIGIFLSFRYIYWRGTETLPLQFGLASLIFGLFLFAAELYGFINTLLGYFINVQPRQRTSPPLPCDSDQLPHVDVYIPTYNEEPNVVRPTVIAATQMRYPKEKLHVYLLDDGGTAQKCNDPNSAKAWAARERAEELKQIAHTFGAQYLTRERNEHAKAGNINHALKQTRGELLVVLDCDHIPTADFLENTVGFFVADPKLFLIQTPHNFVNPDPVERNLATFQSSPAENELFYDVMQPGLDSWGGTFFCGSAAVLRRKVLDEVGGIAGQTITEDAETTLDAISRGYTTAYFKRPMVSGLQPETFSGFIVQRVRWGQGMLQIFMLKNPWTLPGLKFVQRLLYTNFAFFWGFAMSRFVMLLAPPVFLLFSVNLADTTATEVLVYAGPALLGSLITTQYFYGRVRWPFISQLYEVIQSVYVTRGIIEVLRKPRSPSFKVTPKGELLDQDFISSLATPFYYLFALNAAAIAYGIFRYINEPLSRGAVAFVGFWAVLDLLFLLGALGITFERRQARAEPRPLHTEPVSLRMPDDFILMGSTINASASGLSVVIDCPPNYHPPLQMRSDVRIDFPRRGTYLTGTLESKNATDERNVTLGLAYRFASIEEERLAIDIAFGCSEQLIRNNRLRHKGLSIIAGLLYLNKFAFTRGVAHLAFLMKSTWSHLGSNQQNPALEKE